MYKRPLSLYLSLSRFVRTSLRGVRGWGGRLHYRISLSRDVQIVYKMMGKKDALGKVESAVFFLKGGSEMKKTD